MTSLDHSSDVASTGQVVEPILRVRHLSVTHEGSDAATPADVSFTVAPGEVVLLLGPSGSGKSTLTLALNGLIPHAVPADVEGIVEVAGVSTVDTSVAALSTQVAMVFQDPDAQLVTATVLDEVAFAPENLRMPAPEVMRRAEEALRRVGLWERRTENPDRLSGGGRQRLAVACALAMGSPLLVLDEPTANLDPAGIEEVYAALGTLVAEHDRAVVLVEHNLDAAIDFVDRVIVIDHNGCLAFDGPAHSVLRRHGEELLSMGVWLPVSTLAALRLRSAGYAIDPLPLTPAELRMALEAAPRHPRPAPAETNRIGSDGDDGVGEIRLPTGGPRPARDTAAPLIEVSGLTTRRGRTEILHGIDLQVHRGDFVAVVGANGAGKTTLVQAIAGVVPPPRGTVRVVDLDPGHARPRDLAARVGFVFQNPEHQFVAQTVFDELAHGLRLRRMPETEVTARVHDMLDRFGLAGKAGTHPFLLSGGQKRRLSVGTVLIAGAPVIVLDEPTFGQDRARADELLRLLDDLNASGTTVLVVTHDMQLVTEHASHAVVLEAGRLIAHGPTSEVFADRALLERAGLRPPPLAAALNDLTGHPELAGIVRLRDLPASLGRAS